MSAQTSNFVTPGQYRNLVACMVCSFVQTTNYFVRNGCPNCDEVIGLRGNIEKVDDCTSPVFEGIITLHEPSQSWVAKWQRLDSYVPGIYAVKVTGNLPQEVLMQLEDANIVYQPRDGSDEPRREREA